MKLNKFLPFLLAFVLPLVLVYAWWGGFNPVEIETATRGPYTYAYLENIGDYSELPPLLPRVRAALERAGIEPGLPITVLFSNPDMVEVNQRRAHVGLLVAPGTVVEEPLRVAEIPARRVLLARVRSGKLLAPSRAYLALDRHLQASGRGIAMPTVEIYQPADSAVRVGELTVEVEDVQ